MTTQFYENVEEVKFTLTEQYFLKLINEGKTLRSIAIQCGLSQLTVEFHVKNIIQKFKRLLIN